MREGVLPAVLVAAAVIGVSGYFWWEGGAHVVDFAIVSASIDVTSKGDRQVPPAVREVARDDEVMLVDVSWAAADSVKGGAYFVLVTAPRGWRPLACVPECEWRTTSGVEAFADQLPRRTFPTAAVFSAAQEARVTVAFAPPRRAAEGVGDVAAGFESAAWLVQTDGDNVLDAQQIPGDG
jgi:hypothetical protein